MPMLWSILINLIKLDRFKYRSLSLGEIQISKKVYGDLIAYDQVKIMNHPYLPWQPENVLMAPQGYIHVRNAHYSNDYSCETLNYQALFIHEMAHIYQHQHGVNVLLQGAILQSAFYLSIRRYDPYKYTLKAGKRFSQYNIEQQGDIAKDIFLGKIPNIILHPYLNMVVCENTEQKIND